MKKDNIMFHKEKDSNKKVIAKGPNDTVVVSDREDFVRNPSGILQIQSDEGVMFSEDFENNLEQWSIITGAPTIQNDIQSNSHVLVVNARRFEINSDWLISADLSAQLDGNGFYKLSVDKKYETDTSLASIVVTRSNNWGLNFKFEYLNTQWEHFEFVFQNSGGKDYSFNLELRAEEGKTYFDNIRLEKIDPDIVETFENGAISEIFTKNPRYNIETMIDGTDGYIAQITSDTSFSYLPLDVALAIKDVFPASDGNVTYGACIAVTLATDSYSVGGGTVHYQPHENMPGWLSFVNISTDSLDDYGTVGSLPILDENNTAEALSVEYGVGVGRTTNDDSQHHGVVRIKRIEIYRGITMLREELSY